MKLFPSNGNRQNQIKYCTDDQRSLQTEGSFLLPSFRIRFSSLCANAMTVPAIYANAQIIRLKKSTNRI